MSLRFANPLNKQNSLHCKQSKFANRVRISRKNHKSFLIVAMLGILLVMTWASSANAQGRNANGSYHPLNEMTPPGVAGNWSAILGRSTADYFQPVRVDLPSEGRVTFYNVSSSQPVQLPAPAQAGLIVGHTYRLFISHLPEYPGIELYPTIELIDRLHPPPGRKAEFPIPVQLTREEIDFALEGRLVTKVIYLERPQVATPFPLEDPMVVQAIHSPQNIFAEANRLGRPALILRLGGRLPDIRGNDPAFYGTGGPVAVDK